jgi:hypothetical protein
MVLMVLGIIVLVSCGVSAGRGRARVALSETSVSLGSITIGRPATHEFHVKNDGTGVLRLSLPTGSCGCIFAQIDHDEVAPSREAIITVTIDTGQFQDDRFSSADTRAIVKSVDVPTNDPEHRILRLSISVALQAEFELSRYSLSFSDASDELTQSQEVAVRELSTARVIGVRATDSRWVVAQLPRANRANPVRVQVTKSFGVTGPRTGSLIIETSSEYLPELRVFLNVRR